MVRQAIPPLCASRVQTCIDSNNIRYVINLYNVAMFFVSNVVDTIYQQKICMENSVIK